MISLILFSLIKINEIPSLFSPDFVSSDDRFIYVSSKYGIGIFDKYNFTFKKGIILKKEPLYVFPDPFTREIYVYYKDGKLVSFYPEPPFYEQVKGFFPNATSFAITPSTIKIRSGDLVKVYDKFSMIETDKNENPIIWWGLKSIVSFESPEISFLAPFFSLTEDGERINYKLICKDERYYFVCTDGEGVYVYSKDFWRNEAELKAGGGVKDVMVIVVLDNGEVLIAGKGIFSERKGIVIRKNGKWKRYSRFHFGINAEEFYSGLSYKNLVILGSDGKIIIYKEGDFKTTLITRENSRVFAIKIEPPLIFMGTEEGAFVSDIEGGFINALLKDKEVYSLSLSDNYIYLGLFQGLFVIRKKDRELFKIVDKKMFLESRIKDIKKDDEGNIWIMSDKGLLKIKEKSDSFEFFYPVPLPFSPSNFVQNSLYIFDKKIFAGTYKGGFWIYNITFDRWTHYFDGSGISERTVYTFNVKKDTLFVGTDLGIYIYRLK